MNINVTDAAVKLLKFRAYSQYELKNKLLKEGYEEMVVNQALKYVTERGYLDDAALCDMLLAKYAEINKYSLREVFVKLQRRGLPAALINEKLAGWNGEFVEYQAALRLVAKRFPDGQREDRRKVARYLSSKGFKAGTVGKVLEHLRNMSP
ncbi:Regulatory protein RecX [Sporomusa carbonis]|uniref:regulatory protein RecX n=1 Tax=Sporomusa carbonis TaxID=3076075 RepID=UPI003A5E8717